MEEKSTVFQSHGGRLLLYPTFKNLGNGTCIKAILHLLFFILQESEKLETVNAELKAQIEELKQQKQQLVYMLNLHRPTCIVRAQNGQTPEDERNLFIQHIKESALQLQNLTSGIVTSTTTSSSASMSTSTTSLDVSGLLTLDHIQCSGHL